MRSNVVACLATIAVVVPSGWRALDADIPTDGPRLRPAEQVAKIGDASVAVQLDRGAIVAGSTVSATLVATADRAHDVTVALTALEDMGYGDERVERPPAVVGKRTLTLHAAPGGGTPVVATFKLGKLSNDGFAHRFYVTAARPGKAKQADEVASAEMFAWDGNNFAMTVDAPDKVPATGAFVIAVHVKNTTKYPLEEISATVGSRYRGDVYIDSDPDLVEIVNLDTATRDTDEDDARLLAPGEERTLHFRVEPKPAAAEENLTLIVQATAGTKNPKHPHYDDHVGAMDVHTFVRPPREDAKKPPVARR
jgi:hypothetical protein